MTSRLWLMCVAAAFTAAALCWPNERSASALAAEPDSAAAASAAATRDPGAVPAAPLTLEEARGRAQLLHTAFEATLLAVHHQYYREDEGIPIPAMTLRGVFDKLATQRQVRLRWLAVNAEAMNTDHQPRGEFEEAAVKALRSGEDFYERVDGNVYQHVGVITLTADCLKCHLPNRTSTRDRAAGLVIAVPLQAADAAP